MKQTAFADDSCHGLSDARRSRRHNLGVFRFEQISQISADFHRQIFHLKKVFSPILLGSQNSLRYFRYTQNRHPTGSIDNFLQIKLLITDRHSIVLQ